ncbi:Monocarboxylate transporter 12-B [Liparis tanakae]|uniref:Monocarboxylate transporter 12-B n=1 Tax=Liparis tanakae TaxID=230148 RepID=A0A4Z2E6Y5_9TELE|nr:Monocarboxylate transporter 12-B [Liparis tanakae]
MEVTAEEKLRGGRRPEEVTTPTEGGWGWMVVAGCFLATICIRAVTRILETSGSGGSGSGGLGPAGPGAQYGFLVEADFLLLCVSFLLLAFGCGPPVVYLVPYARSAGLGARRAALLMSAFGVSGIAGNVTFGWIADRKCVRRFRLAGYSAAVGAEGLCCAALHLLRSFPLLLPFALLYGYFDGAYVALIPVVTSDIVGSAHLASALGVVYFLHAIPYLISPPIGGRDYQEGSRVKGQVSPPPV